MPTRYRNVTQTQLAIRSEHQVTSCSHFSESNNALISCHQSYFRLLRPIRSQEALVYGDRTLRTITKDATRR